MTPSGTGAASTASCRALPTGLVSRISNQSATTSNPNGDDPPDNDFALQEFLDRYGMRLAQLGTIINLVAPLAEVGPQQNESA